MRILVVGAGRIGARVLQQLQKNRRLAVVTLDPRPEPFAVSEGIIDGVDIAEALTPLTLELVLEQAQPDLILLTMTTEDLALGKAPGLDILTEALKEELAQLSDAPVVEVARKGL
jgi:3-hydroxyacyl-CoA dehydrogenase